MKPDWDTLMQEHEGSESALIADVDCTAAGTPLCQQYGVNGYPTLKWGDPDMLQEYQGSRDLEALQAFARNHLTARPKKSDWEKATSKMARSLDRYLGPLRGDIEHILGLRKNAAVVLIVGGFLAGCLFMRLMSCLCRTRKATVDKKND